MNVITGAVVAAGVRIHQKLGPGLLESVYEIILARDLTRLGFRVERQKPITFEFEGTTFESAFRPDLIINDAVIVEVKAARALDPVFQRQVLTYLKIMKLRLGLVMNFGDGNDEGRHPPHRQLNRHPVIPVLSVPLCGNDAFTGREYG